MHLDAGHRQHSPSLTLPFVLAGVDPSLHRARRNYPSSDLGGSGSGDGCHPQGDAAILCAGGEGCGGDSTREGAPQAPAWPTAGGWLLPAQGAGPRAAHLPAGGLASALTSCTQHSHSALTLSTCRVLRVLWTSRGRRYSWHLIHNTQSRSIPLDLCTDGDSILPCVTNSDLSRVR